jgi:hypothetical protein
MAELDLLLSNYQSHVSTPWRDGLSGSERVWFLVYSPANERRLRHRLEEFALATRDAGHGWTHLDITDAFPRWIASHRHAERTFQNPAGLTEQQFVDVTSARIRELLHTAGDRDVVAISGVGSLFGLTPLSAVLKLVDESIKGRLLVCFPGTYERDFHRYHLLGAGEGWSYLAAPILAQREAFP